MIKVGERYITTNFLNKDYNGALAEVRSIDGGRYYCTVIDRKDSSLRKGFHFATSEKYLIPMIQEGEQYIITGPSEITKGTIVKALFPDPDRPHMWRCRVLSLPDAAKNIFKVGQEAWAENKYMKPKKLLDDMIENHKKCICDIWKGCTCGAITPYKVKW